MPLAAYRAVSVIEQFSSLLALKARNNPAPANETSHQPCFTIVIGGLMDFIVNLLIVLPARIASYFAWAGPLVMRLVVGYVFMLTGWGKLNNLPQMIQNFTDWGIPFPRILTPFVSGVECFGGIMLILGLFTRIPAAMLAVVMLVAIKSAKWENADSLETLLGFEEVTYFAAFLWLAIAGPGAVSLDRLLLRTTGNEDAPK